MRLRVQPWGACSAGPGGWHRAAVRAFTLPEVLIAATVFLMLVAALVSTNIWGQRMSVIAQGNVDVSMEAALVEQQLKDDIVTARTVEVGTGDFYGFSVGAPFREGNAVQMTNVVGGLVSTVRYYRDGGDGILKRSVDGGTPEDLITGVGNSTNVFQSVDFAGGVLTNDVERTAVQVRLELNRVGRADVPVGSGYGYVSNNIVFVVMQRRT